MKNRLVVYCYRSSERLLKRAAARLMKSQALSRMAVIAARKRRSRARWNQAVSTTKMVLYN